jgi:tripartite ATP-independent transporter DctP family solute receptor
MKRYLCILLVLLLVCLPLTACNKSPASQPEAEKTNKAEPATEKSTEARVLRLAHNITMGGTDDQAANMLAEKVKEKSGGTLEIKVYPGGQLGNERDMLEGIQLGSIDMGLNTSAYISNIAPEFGLLDVPFLFSDFEDVRNALSGDGGEYLKEKLLKEQGIRVLNWWNSSFRIMLTKSAPIKSLDDLKGRKMRAPEVPVYIDMFDALGANPTPIPFGEVYTSIQTGVVDGVEVCAEEMYAMKFHEVGKYIAKTNHIFSTMIPIINEDVFQSLTPDQQKVLQEAVDETTDWQWDAFRAADEHALQAMGEAGVEINEIDQAPLAEACAEMQMKYATDYNAVELLEMLKK